MPGSKSAVEISGKEKKKKYIPLLERDAVKFKELLRITENLNHVKDVDSLLDSILYEARLFTNADAGTIYLADGNNLKYSYVQNDTLAKIDEANNKYIYSIFEIPINDKSMSGYVALTGKPLIIDDVYNIRGNVPYSFNSYFDEISSYKTISALTVPLITSRQHVIGVMQILNSKNKKGEIIPFTKEDMMYVAFFANNASVAIERAQMTREILLRMIKMAELRDPKETGNHVNRVASYSIEIYERWAKKKGLPLSEIKQTKDVLRIAAMLHDVGKVAISDTILKKPGKLSPEEFEMMKMHTIFGARLFDNSVSDWDALSAEVALNHHERWDGKGYMGRITNKGDEFYISGPGKKGEEIPILGRIVALADVYDALISIRVYKQAWLEEDVLKYIKEGAGKHFDPDVVEAFFSIYDVIKAIREKYAD
jgi:response regulator RpfG family c-di-GMP phosphodiesterase